MTNLSETALIKLWGPCSLSRDLTFLTSRFYLLHPLSSRLNMPYSEDFQDILEGIDEAQLLAEIGEEELARQADMLDLLEKKEATVEDGQLVRAPAPNTPHRSQPAHTPHSHTPHSHTPLTPRTPFRKHSSSTLTEGGLSKFFEPGSEERRAAEEEQLKADEEDGGGQDSDEEEPFDCSAEVSCACTVS